MRSSKAARGCVRVRDALVFASLLCSVSPALMAQDPPPAPAQAGPIPTPWAVLAATTWPRLRRAASSQPRRARS